MADYEVRTQIYLERSQHETLKHKAAEKSISMAHLIREAVAEYLAKDDLEAATSFDLESYHNDPIWKILEIADHFEGTGWTDAAENHDHYIYDLDKP